MSHFFDADLVSGIAPSTAKELRELCADLSGLGIAPHLHGSRAFNFFRYRGEKLAELYVGELDLFEITDRDVFTLPEGTDWDLAVPDHPDMVGLLEARGYYLLEGDDNRYRNFNGYMDSNTISIYRKNIGEDNLHFDVSIRNDFKLFQTVMKCLNANIYTTFLWRKENHVKRMFLEMMYTLYRNSVSSGLWR